MSNDSTSSEGGAAIEMPAMHADVAVITRNAFTVHLRLGASLPGGLVRPQGIVCMSEAFARSLCAQLIALLEVPVRECDDVSATT
jgi:hypothetical protein